MPKINFLILALLLNAVAAFSQTIPFRTFGHADAFGSEVSWTIYKDKRGFIWAGPTGMGAVAFDGKRYYRFTDKDGLAGNFVISFLHDRNDNMWFGCQGQGISIYDGKRFINISEKDSLGLITDNILSMYETSNGMIYLGTFGNGLQQFDGTFIKSVDTTCGSMTVYDMVEDAHGILWLGTRDSGIARVENGKISFPAHTIGLPSGMVLDLELNGDELLICSENGLYHYTPGSTKATLEQAPGVPQGKISCCTVLPDGTIILQSARQLFKLEKDGATKISSHGNLPFPFTRMVIDNAGQVWASSNGEGVIQLIPNGFEVMSMGDNNGIYAVCEDSLENLYVATRHAIYQLKGVGYDNAILRVQIPDEYGKVRWLIARDSTHFIFGVDNAGTFRSSKGPQDMELLVEADPHDALLKDSNTLLILHSNSLLDYDLQKKTFTRFYPLGQHPIFYAACKAKNGDYWAGTYEEGSIFQMSQTDTVLYDTEDGLKGGAILCMLEDVNHRVWYLDIDGNFGYFNGTGFTVFDPVAPGEVGTFVSDNQGDLWFSGKYGIAQADFENDQLVAVNVYDETDGVNQKIPSGVDAICLKNGKLLIPKSDSKMYLFDPAAVHDIEQKPQVYLSSIRGRDGVMLDSTAYFSNSGLFSIPQAIELPYAENNLTVHVGAVYYANQDSLKYTYQLVGYDETWSNPKAEGEMYFTNLPAGKYELKIKAQTPSGLESEILSFPFTVETPWFQSWLFYSICIVTGVLIIWLIFRWRFSKLRKDRERLEKVVAERTREVIHEKELVEERNKAILDSINYAKRLQNAILPGDEKLKKGLGDYFLFYQPKDIVSGDFYWFEEVGDECYLAVADCTGHGVPGAMVSTVCANALNKSLQELHKKSPAEILDSTRELVTGHFAKGSDAVKDGMDVTLIRFNRKTRLLEFSGANNHLWIASKTNSQELVQLTADKQPVGNYAYAKPFTNTTFQLQSGDVVYMSSDGFQDQFGGEKGKKFKASNLKKMLFELQNKSMDEQCGMLKKTFDNWKSDFEQVDDICVMGVRV